MHIPTPSPRGHITIDRSTYFALSDIIRELLNFGMQTTGRPFVAVSLVEAAASKLEGDKAFERGSRDKRLKMAIDTIRRIVQTDPVRLGSPVSPARLADPDRVMVVDAVRFGYLNDTARQCILLHKEGAGIDDILEMLSVQGSEISEAYRALGADGLQKLFDTEWRGIL
ncbi:MAG TPA: hypothetical protein VHE55_15970 [Fimbriimonadaceae bacterium]|nr:hypothetical protein [Fimbriimonadaceae bacterium]